MIYDRRPNPPPLCRWKKSSASEVSLMGCSNEWRGVIRILFSSLSGRSANLELGLSMFAEEPAPNEDPKESGEN